MPDFINPNPFVVELPGPDGHVVKVKSGQRVTLPAFFLRYQARGRIKLVPGTNSPLPIQSHIQLNNTRRQDRIPIQAKAPRAQLRLPKRRTVVTKSQTVARKPKPEARRVVGKQVNANATELLHQNLMAHHYPISNGVGVGILSYNRLSSLRRLLESIEKYTDLRNTTVFISDDGSTESDLLQYLDELSKGAQFVILKNKQRLGVAGNTNRLLQCLNRFEHCLLLNDDVEILAAGWDKFYSIMAQRAALHHFVYRQPGVYGAEVGSNAMRNGVNLRTVLERPQGAVLFFTNDYFKSVGYFDESYGLYGMEHVDWSQKAWELGVQDKGFFDVVGSDLYFKVHSEQSVVPDRSKLLMEARKKFQDRVPSKITSTLVKDVPAITYVVPVRDQDREDAIRTVINNLRAQRFPVVELILVEQDATTSISVDKLNPIAYYLVPNSGNGLFNKSKAFNLGVSKSTTGRLILHDADIMVQDHYTTVINKMLDKYDACHLGKSVLYADEVSSNHIALSTVVGESVKCNRMVGYFEGGSIACRTKTFWDVGAFNEDFYGYGVEDCDFYARLSSSLNWKEDRSFDFLHLWHGRTPGWESHHQVNKAIEEKLRTKSIADRIKLQKVQLLKNGYDPRLVNQ